MVEQWANMKGNSLGTKLADKKVLPMDGKSVDMTVKQMVDKKESTTAEPTAGKKAALRVQK